MGPCIPVYFCLYQDNTVSKGKVRLSKEVNLISEQRYDMRNDN